MATQEEIDNSNTLAIEANTASIIEILTSVQSESDRAIAAETAIQTTLTEAITAGTVVDMKKSIVATTEMTPITAQTEENAGTVYLLTEEQEGFVKNRMYRLLKDEDSGDLYYSDIKLAGIPVGNVYNIKFSFVGGVLSMRWHDPDDVVVHGATVSKWAGTRVMYKAYSSVQPVEITAYPQSPFDGTLLVNSTERNQYNLNSFSATGLDANKVYYVRFFPYTEDGVYTIGTESPTENRFYTEEYDWGTLLGHLEDYPSDSALLPNAGDAITVKYLIDDFYTDSSTNTYRLTLTRESLISALEKDTANWNVTNTTWRILGYNKSVPQYIKYRRTADDGTYDYKYVSSVNDTVQSFDFILLNGTTVSKQVLTGDLYLKTSGISVGDQVYSCEYDGILDKPVYKKESYNISEIPSEYGNFTYGDYNTFSAPMKIVANGYEYDFCGYTMTIQPQDLLTGAHPTNDNVPTTTTVNNYQTLQFDPPEASSSSAFNVYPTPASASSDYGYYYKNDDGDIVAIDVLGQSLGGSYTQLYNGKDVLTLNYDEHAPADADGNTIPSFKTETQYFENGHRYAHSDGTVMTAGTDYTVGDVIPTDEAYLELNKDNNRVTYGCNIYAQSAYRQSINNRYGANDDWYKPQNKFESTAKPTYAMANTNGILLKLKKEPEFLNKIIPVVNRTQVSTPNQYYIKNTSTFYYVIDYVFPLSRLEVNFSDAPTTEGAAKYSDVYTADNATRIKKYILRDGTLGSANIWWLRSPSTGNSNFEYIVTNAGASNYSVALNSCGCAPACVIG